MCVQNMRRTLPSSKDSALTVAYIRVPRFLDHLPPDAASKGEVTIANENGACELKQSIKSSAMLM
jgi:hypothetical protein